MAQGGRPRHSSTDCFIDPCRGTPMLFLDAACVPLHLCSQKTRMPPAIEFRDLEFRIPSGRLLLDRVSLSLDEGTVTAILGRSGSGKTTLLRTVNRMIEPTAGTVLVNSRDVRDADLITLRRGMGYVIQETGLFPHFTVDRNVGLVLEAQGQPRDQRNQRSRELLSAVGLDPDSFALRHPHQLSGGQRQRV